MRTRVFARPLLFIALGLLYAMIVSPGYFAQKDQWGFGLMFGLIRLMTLNSIRQMISTKSASPDSGAFIFYGPGRIEFKPVLSELPESSQCEPKDPAPATKNGSAPLVGAFPFLWDEQQCEFKLNVLREVPREPLESAWSESRGPACPDDFYQD